MLEIKKISKIYETEDLKQVALNKVSINFRKSEFASILGPSGSGKTTLLNIIGGLDHYDSGDLKINEVSTKNFNDRDWDSYRNHRVGFVFQNYNLISHQTILQNVELALTLSGVSKQERIKKAKEALKEVGLEKHINKKPNQLSGGQMQRVAIARALVNNPDIVLADEPTGALDTVTSEQIMELLKKVAKDKLVIMVTHNPELAEKYSTRIIKLRDGELIDDTNPYDGKVNTKESTELVKKKSGKTQMSLRTALSLSLNNLMTKKGRTILTSFAGSIGIIGIALILSLSNGIQKYIDKTEEETLSSYPLSIEKNTVDMSSMITALTGNQEKKEYNDNDIHALNIMGDMFTTMSKKVKTNDLKSFKEYIESNNEFTKYTSAIDYGYNVTLNLYKQYEDKTYLQVNPTTVFDSIGMSTGGMSNAYSGFMSSYDVFTKLYNNEEVLHNQYNLVDGNWPTKYNELVLMVNDNNEITDYTLYSLGILSQSDLKEQFNNMTSGKEVSFEETSYKIEDLLNLSFKLVLNTDYYEKKNGVWIDMSKDQSYMKKVLENATELKIVGIVKPNEEAVSNSSRAGLVGYTNELMEYVINKINESEIAKEQLKNSEINVFTGKEFSNTASFDYSKLTREELMKLQSMSEEELANYIATYQENANSSYKINMAKLGIADLSDPDSVNIYPKDFDSKEEITRLIDEYNKDKEDEGKIEYTDVVGIMMSSVSTIVGVISSVLIAFVAISLVVSSIMIAIITYISVIERTKEIGILRSIGASKKDISRVFNAETFIEGLSAGILGIVVTILLDIPINIIIKHTVNISNIALLPTNGAIILIIISVILTVIAGLIPSKIASKKDPVESLRSE